MTFQEIYTQHSKLVYNLALSYVQNREDAEEITQDVFVSVYQGLTTFREESQLSTWIYRISINKSLDFISSLSKAAFRIGPWYQHANTNPYDLCLDTGSSATLKEWIHELMHTLQKIY